jgi:hypothetical protein
MPPHFPFARFLRALSIVLTFGFRIDEHVDVDRPGFDSMVLLVNIFEHAIGRLYVPGRCAMIRSAMRTKRPAPLCRISLQPGISD